jgi:hypothetical protein
VKAAKELKWQKGQQFLAEEMQKYHGPHYLPPPLNPSPTGHQVFYYLRHYLTGKFLPIPQADLQSTLRRELEMDNPPPPPFEGIIPGTNVPGHWWNLPVPIGKDKFVGVGSIVKVFGESDNERIKAYNYDHDTRPGRSDAVALKAKLERQAAAAAAAEAAQSAQVKAAKELKWHKGQQLLAQEMKKYHGPHYPPPPASAQAYPPPHYPPPPPTSDKLPEGWRASVDPVTNNPVWVNDAKGIVRYDSPYNDRPPKGGAKNKKTSKRRLRSRNASRRKASRRNMIQ